MKIVLLLLVAMVCQAIPRATCPHDLEVLCIQDINAGTDQMMSSLPSVR